MGRLGRGAWVGAFPARAGVGWEASTHCVTTSEVSSLEWNRRHSENLLLTASQDTPPRFKTMSYTTRLFSFLTSGTAHAN